MSKCKKIIIFVILTIILNFTDVSAQQHRLNRPNISRSYLTSNPSKYRHKKRKKSKKKGILYDKAIDLRINEVINKANKLFDNDPNAAIEMIVKEQLWLEKRGYGKTIPLAKGKKGPALPSPFIITLATFKHRMGAEPVDIIDYYKDIIRKYPSTVHAIDCSILIIKQLKFNENEISEFIDEFNNNSQSAIYTSLLKIYAQDEYEISKEKIIFIISRIHSENKISLLKDIYSNLRNEGKDRLEEAIWETSDNLKDLKVKFRTERAVQAYHRLNFERSCKLYKSILNCYKEEDFILSKIMSELCKTQVQHIQYMYSKNLMNNVIALSKKYRTETLKDYPDMNKSALVNEALALICLKQDLEAKNIIISNNINETDISNNNSFLNTKFKNKEKITSFFWNQFKDWHKFNKENYLVIVKAMLNKQDYIQVEKLFCNVKKRYGELSIRDSVSYLQTRIICGSLDLPETNLLFKRIDAENDKKLEEFAYQKLVPSLTECIRKNLFKEALSILSFAENYKPNDELSFLRSYCLVMMGDMVTGQKILEKLILKTNKKSISIKAKLVLRKQSVLKEINEKFENPAASFLKKECNRLIETGHFQEATTVYTKILVEYPNHKNNDKAYYSIGYYYLLTGEFKIAKEIFTYLTQNYPQSQFISHTKLCLARIKSMTESKL